MRTQNVLHSGHLLLAKTCLYSIFFPFVDSSKCVIALVSNDYLHSKVCMEEFSLSLALQQQNNSRVVPLIIEPLKENIEWFSLLSPLNCFKEPEKDEDHPITDVCKTIVRELEGKNYVNKISVRVYLIASHYVIECVSKNIQLQVV